MTCSYETARIAEDNRLAHNPEVADPYLVLATSGNASGRASPLAVVMPLVNTDRLVGSRRPLMVQQRERRFACLAS